jgi:hypothetical protein
MQATTGVTEEWSPGDERAAWREYTRRMPDHGELSVWFSTTTAFKHVAAERIGMVCGKISGGLTVIDFEHPDCWAVWKKIAVQLAGARSGVLEQVEQVLESLTVVQTLKGHHVYFKMPEPPRHQVLCSSQGHGEDALVFSEVQGEGCYVVAPPSIGSPAGGEFRSYTVVQGRMSRIPVVSQEIGDMLLAAATFPGLFEMHLSSAECDTWVVQLHRDGLTIKPEKLTDCGLLMAFSTLNWQQVRKLQHWIERYAPLLRAVEMAPPPPESYWESDEDICEDYE